MANKFRDLLKETHAQRIHRGDRVRITGPIAALAGPRVTFVGRVLDVDPRTSIATVELEIRAASGMAREQGRLISSHVSYLEKEHGTDL